MKVNTDKTQLLVISDALTYDPAACIKDSQDNQISSSKGIKVLGFHMSDRPNVAAHVEALRKQF